MTDLLLILNQINILHILQIEALPIKIWYYLYHISIEFLLPVLADPVTIILRKNQQVLLIEHHLSDPKQIPLNILIKVPNLAAHVALGRCLAPNLAKLLLNELLWFENQLVNFFDEKEVLLNGVARGLGSTELIFTVTHSLTSPFPLVTRATAAPHLPLTQQLLQILPLRLSKTIEIGALW